MLSRLSVANSSLEGVNSQTANLFFVMAMHADQALVLARAVFALMGDLHYFPAARPRQDLPLRILADAPYLGNNARQARSANKRNGAQFIETLVPRL